MTKRNRDVCSPKAGSERSVSKAVARNRFSRERAVQTSRRGVVAMSDAERYAEEGAGERKEERDPVDIPFEELAAGITYEDVQREMAKATRSKAVPSRFDERECCARWAARRARRGR